MSESSQSVSAQEQKEAVEAVLTDEVKKLKEGDTWCFVSKKWFARWINYSQCESFWEVKPDSKAEVVSPGEIDNSPLLMEVKGKYPVTEIRRDLQEIRDYFTIPEAVYDLLQKWHKGGPKISRIARSQTIDVVESKVRIVKHPIHLAILENDNKGNPEEKAVMVKAYAPVDSLKSVREDIKNMIMEEKKEAKSSEEGEAEPEGLDDAADAVKFRIWIPVEENKAEILESDPEDVENECEKEIKWQLLEEIQEGMELGTFNFKPGATPILIERQKDGKWVRDGKEGGGNWREELKTGSKLDVLDTVNTWLAATVRDVKEEEGKRQILIHYDGYSADWDEWVVGDSDRLAKKDSKADKHTSRGYSSSYSYSADVEGVSSTRGIVGFRNLGNTCFMNSTLQCMMQTPWLSQYLIENLHVKEINKDNPLGHNGRIAEEYGRLVQKVWSSKYTVVAPSSFKQAIGEFAPQFSGYNQQDSQELLSFLVDGLHEDMNRLKKKAYDPNPLESDGKTDQVLAGLSWAKHKTRHDSIILDHMGGMFRSKVVCPKCSKESRKFDPFLLTLPLILPNSNTKSQEVTVVFADTSKSPTKVSVDISKGSKIDDLKTEVAALVEVDAKSLIIAEVFSNKIYKQYDEKEDVEAITTRDVIYAFECPDLTKLEDWISIPVHQVHKHAYYRDDVTEFGTPRIVILRENTTIAEAKKAVVQILEPFVEKDAKPYKDSKVQDYPFSCTYESTYGSSEPVDILGGDDTAELELSRREMVFSVYWGEKEEVKESYKAETVINHETMKPKASSKGGVNLADCLVEFTREEKLKAGNEFYCRTCKELLTVTKKMDIWKLPDVMCIQLKRFEYTRNWRNKIGTHVEFPLEGLNMAPHTLSPEDKKNSVYDLYAVSCHGGGLGGGHYWAYVRNLTDKKWYRMDDSSTSAMPESNVVTSEAYLLFYARRGFGDKPSAKVTKPEGELDKEKTS
ncbi:hypothetical protein AAMO2058_001570100 [Amorphochlora amoebiformis]